MTTAIHQSLDADGILLLTIDVPGQTMNVITPEVNADLAAAVARIKSDDAVKGAVLTSGKASGFMAGADLKGMAEIFGDGGGDPAKSKMANLFDGVYALNKQLRELETCGKPVAVAINGLALGGGLEFTLACHYRVCADNPKIVLGLPEVLVGLFPGGGGTQRLPRLIGRSDAMLMLLTGEPMDAADALRTGLVSRVVPRAALRDEALAIARRIAANAPLAVRAAKRLVNQGADLPLGAALAAERTAWGLLRDTEDRLEGRRAFAEKRLPVYRGR